MPTSKPIGNLHETAPHALENPSVSEHQVTGTGSVWIPIAPLSTLDRAFVVAFMTLLPGATIPTLANLTFGPQAPKWLFYLGMYAVGALMAAQRGRLTLQGLRANPVIVLLACLAVTSTLWSVLPGETLASSLTLIGPMLFAIVLASAVRPEESLRLLAIASFAIALTNWFAIVAIPSVGIDQSGPWAGTPRGLHVQKNALGATAAIAMTVLMAYAMSHRDGRKIWVVIGFLLHLGLVIVARSTTSVILAIAGVAILFLPRGFMRFAALGLPSIMGLAAFVFIVIPESSGYLLAELAPLVGKDATMSNRLPIWQVLTPFVEAKPLLGYGYGVFWHEAVSPSLLFESRLGFDPGSAHNGLLEIWLSFGMLGAVLCIVALIQFFFQVAIALKRLGDDALTRLAMSVGVLQVAHNVTESAFLSRNEAEWLIFIWVWATIGVRLAQRRLA